MTWRKRRAARKQRRRDDRAYRAWAIEQRRQIIEEAQARNRADWERQRESE